MSNRVVRVTVPDPHTIGLGGPEWRWSGTFGDQLCVNGVPAGEDAPANVALYLVEDIEPFAEATGYISPAAAREVAGALIAAAEYAEGRWS